MLHAVSHDNAVAHVEEPPYPGNQQPRGALEHLHPCKPGLQRKKKRRPQAQRAREIDFLLRLYERVLPPTIGSQPEFVRRIPDRLFHFFSF